MSRRAQRIAAVIGMAIAALATVVLWRYVGTPLVQFASNPAAFREWVNSHGPYSRIAFVGMTVFQIIIAVVPGEPFELAAGYAFGAWEGTALCIVSCIIGSFLTFMLVRRFGVKLLRVFFSEEQIESVSFLKSSPKRDILFFIVYMLPGTPKDLLGYFAGLTDIRLARWMLICSLGRLPSVVTSTVGGNYLGRSDYRLAIWVFALTLVLSGAGLLLYRWICRRQKGDVGKT